MRLDDIDIVVATHIHIDHVGWHTTARTAGSTPTFPKATYVFDRDEFAYWTGPDVAKATPWVLDCVQPLEGVAEISLVGRRAQADG